MTTHAWTNYDDALTPWRRVEVTDEELQEPCAGA